MTKGIFTFIFSITATTILAQGEMNNLALEANPNLCKPGVFNKSPSKGLSISYTFNPAFKMHPVNAETASEVQANQRFSSKIKIPVLNCRRAKFLLGFKYATERYRFENISPENHALFHRLNKAQLKDIESAAYLFVPINQTIYTSFRFGASFRGDYSDFINTNSDYATYRLAGMVGIKKNEDFEYGMGIYFSKSIQRMNIYPFGFLNWTFNEKWGLEAAIPMSVKLRRNFNEGNLLLFGVDYSSQNYTLQVAVPSNNTQLEKLTYHYRRASMEISASYLKQFSGWAWMQYKVGYYLNLNSAARDLTNDLNYALRPSGSIVGTVSFFLSPPKKYLK